MQTEARPKRHDVPPTRNEDLKCWQTSENPLCLRIFLSDETEFILPYGYFESAKLLRERDRETLHLHFKSQTFAVKGKSLTELVAAFQTLSVAWLKKCPHRYKPLADKDRGIIETIEHVTDEKQTKNDP